MSAPDGRRLRSRPVSSQGQVSEEAAFGRRRWLVVLATAGGVALGAVLLFGAYAKAIDPEAFAETIVAEGLDFLLPATAVVYVALALEVGLGSALLLGLRRTWVLCAATALVVFLVFLTGRTYVEFLQGRKAEAESCGCFGRLVERSPAVAFWQDVGMLVPTLVLAWFGRPTGWRLPKGRGIAAGGVTILALVFAALAPSLPLDDLATRLSVGRTIGEICMEQKPKPLCFQVVIPDLAEGRHLVVIVDIDAPGYRAQVQAINELNVAALDGKGPPVWVVAATTEEKATAAKVATGAGFDIRPAPKGLLRPLYRRLPRSFLVVDGRVRQTWDGLPAPGSLTSPPPR